MDRMIMLFFLNLFGSDTEGGVREREEGKKGGKKEEREILPSICPLRKHPQQPGLAGRGDDRSRNPNWFF